MIDSLVLGLVEGITEFLPISSTGHLLVAEHLLGSQKSDAYNVLIQVGPIFAATLVFWNHIMFLLTGLDDPRRRDEVLKLGTSFVITGIGGLALKHFGLKLPETVLPIALATLIGGFVILFVERMVARKPSVSEEITWEIVLAVAAGQLLAAAFPGASRSGSTVIFAIALGLARPAAVRFAFLVGIPTMFAAGGLQIHEAIKAGQRADLVAPDTLFAFAVATVSAFVAVKWLLKFVQSNTFRAFAWYRIAMGIGLIVAMRLGWSA
jgi:undecaprenyl-diphosphatase